MFPSKPALAVDWDGTCVEHVFPAEGDWLYGAPQALKQLTKKYSVFIYTCRIAPVMFQAWNESYPEEDIAREIAYIQRMLKEQGLDEIEIWTEPYKIPAVAYVDDRGIRFNGDWTEVLDAL